MEHGKSKDKRSWEDDKELHRSVDRGEMCERKVTSIISDPVSKSFTEYDEFMKEVSGEEL